MIRLLWLSIIAFLCVGCQSAGISVQQYQLAKAPVPYSAPRPKTQLVIEPVVLVDYLKRANILLKQQENMLYVTKYHVWAEPLDNAIARAMVNYLNNESKVLRVDHSLYTQCADKAACFRLTLLVESFYPTDKSTASFSGKYQLSQNAQVVEQQDFNFTNELELDGYPHAVEKLQALIYQLSSQIEQQVAAKM